MQLLADSNRWTRIECEMCGALSAKLDMETAYPMAKGNALEGFLELNRDELVGILANHDRMDPGVGSSLGALDIRVANAYYRCFQGVNASFPSRFGFWG